MKMIKTKILIYMVIMTMLLNIATAIECNANLTVTPCEITNHLTINSGTYTTSGAITISANNKVIDGNNAVIDNNNTGTIILITGSENTLKNFVLKNGKMDASSGGIVIQNGHNNTITNNEVYDSFAGVGIVLGQNNTIDDNEIYNNYYNVYIGSDTNPSLHNYVENNYVYNATVDGVYVDDNCNNNTINNNNIDNNGGNGVYVWKSDYQTITNNNITNHAGGAGIHIFGSQNNYIYNNYINNNKIGLTVRSGAESTSNNTINENTITNSEIGINMIDSAYDGVNGDNDFYQNIIKDNTLQVNLTDMVADNDYEYNYWDETPEGIDYTPYYTTESMTRLNTYNPNKITGNTIEGLPSIGEDMGGFMANIAPGIGIFLIIITVFGGIGTIVYAVVISVKQKTKEK